MNVDVLTVALISMAVVMAVPGAVYIQNTGEIQDADIHVTSDIIPVDPALGPVEASDETLKVRNDVLLSWEGNGELIGNSAMRDFWDGLHVNGISSIYPSGVVEIVFDDIHADEIDRIRENILMLYPGSELIVRIGGIALDLTEELERDSGGGAIK